MSGLIEFEDEVTEYYWVKSRISSKEFENLVKQIVQVCKDLLRKYDIEVSKYVNIDDAFNKIFNCMEMINRYLWRGTSNENTLAYDYGVDVSEYEVEFEGKRWREYMAEFWFQSHELTLTLIFKRRKDADPRSWKLADALVTLTIPLLIIK